MNCSDAIKQNLLTTINNQNKDIQYRIAKRNAYVNTDYCSPNGANCGNLALAANQEKAAVDAKIESMKQITHYQNNNNGTGYFVLQPSNYGLDYNDPDTIMLLNNAGIYNNGSPFQEFWTRFVAYKGGLYPCPVGSSIVACSQAGTIADEPEHKCCATSKSHVCNPQWGCGGWDDKTGCNSDPHGDNGTYDSLLKIGPCSKLTTNIFDIPINNQPGTSPYDRLSSYKKTLIDNKYKPLIDQAQAIYNQIVANKPVPDQLMNIYCCQDQSFSGISANNIGFNNITQQCSITTNGTNAPTSKTVK